MMDETSKSDVKQVSDEESDILLLKAFLRVLEELKEDFSLGGNIYFSQLSYEVSSRERLVDNLKWTPLSAAAKDAEGEMSDEPEDHSTLLEACIKGMYELADTTIKRANQNNLSLLSEVLCSAINGALDDPSPVAELLVGHAKLASSRVLFALGKPVSIPEIVDSLIKFASDATPCWLEWRECAGNLLSEVDSQTIGEISKRLGDLCEDNPAIWKSCRELLDESSFGDDYDGLLFNSLYSRMTSGNSKSVDFDLDEFVLYSFESEGRRLYFRKDLATLARLFQTVVSQGITEDDKRFYAFESARNSLLDDMAGILFYYVDVLERYSDTQRLRMALLEIAALLGLYSDEPSSGQDIETLCGVILADIAGLTEGSLPVSDEGSLILANSYAHLARCVLPRGTRGRTQVAEVWEQYLSASKYYQAAWKTLCNSHTWSLLDSARDYNIDEFSRREVIVRECSKLSALFSNLLG